MPPTRFSSCLLLTLKGRKRADTIFPVYPVKNHVIDRYKTKNRFDHRSNSLLAVKRGSFRFHLVFLSAELSPLQTVTRRGGDTGRRERWRDCNARSPLLQSDAGRSAECGVLQAEWVVETSLHLWRKVIFVDRSEDRIWPWVASSWRTPPLVS